ncbi:MAG: AGE family epimerase/isomerase [Armatimonadota bacterium]|nr:AGE family epimerase/isomerase [Armatimonadota bacterium]
MNFTHAAFLRLCLCLVGILLPICAVHAATPAPTTPPADAASYQRLEREVETNLQQQVLAQWFPRAIDPTGGFYQNYSEDWTRGASDDKAIVYQARLMWVASQAALRYPAQAEMYKADARHGLDFLADKMWDAQNGGFYWGLDDKGVPVRDGEKHAYGISFAIYAACGEYQATHDSRALELAKRAYRWLDAHAHDIKNGGYYEALTRQGKPILTPTDAQPNDEIGTRYGFKTMNTHIHLLESLSALYQVWPDAGLRARLEEMFALVRDKIAVESVGALNYQFTPAWQPLPDHDSFGHDVETAYLLTEASAVLGRPEDARTWRLARRIVDHALDFGWDNDNGGFYDSGSVFGGTPYTTDKIWWVEAEGLNSLLLMHRRYGKETPRYWAAFNKQWDFIQTHQVDAVHGGWQATVTRDGASIPGRAKSDGWTEAYHQSRALLNVSADLRRLTDGAK